MKALLWNSNRNNLVVKLLPYRLEESTIIINWMKCLLAATTRHNIVSRVWSASASISRTAPGAAAGVKGYVCWASRPGPWPRPVPGRARSIGQSALWFFYTCPADCRERTIRVSEAGSSDVGSRLELFEATGQYIFGIVKLTKYLITSCKILFTKYFVSQSLVEIKEDSFSTLKFSFIHSKFTHFCLLSVTMNYVKLKRVSEINAVCRRVSIPFGIADQIWQIFDKLSFWLRGQPLKNFRRFSRNSAVVVTDPSFTREHFINETIAI